MLCVVCCVGCLDAAGAYGVCQEGQRSQDLGRVFFLVNLDDRVTEGVLGVQDLLADVGVGKEVVDGLWQTTRGKGTKSNHERLAH